VLVADVDPVKRQSAIDLGADAAVDLRDAAGDALVGTIRVVFDFVGTDETLAQAARLVARGGLISLVGEAGGRLSFGFRQLAVEASVTTTSWGTKRELEEVVQLARAGEMRWETELVPLTRANEALERLATGDVSGRLVLVP
jgi:alcohol dehydrogenase, propanol-preferring